jgi:hypothetical protein
LNKSELLSAIDRLTLYEKDYESVKSLLAIGDDRFFVKVIEEIVLGNIRFTDLYRVFSDQKYSQALERNLEAQRRLKEEIERTIAFRRETGPDPDYSIDPETTEIGVTRQDSLSPTKEFYDQLTSEEKSKMVYDLLSPDQSDGPVTRQSKLAVYSAFSAGTISEEDILLFARDYIVPISYENQVLNGSDLSFMVENNLSQDQVKKIKALSVFLRRRVI